MKINSKIFKAYDIRGIYPEEVNEDSAYKIGRAFVRFLKKKNPKIVAGRDNRISSDSLFKALVRGITEEGGNVVDIGLTTTPMFYWTTAHFRFDGGINITASHNPPQYNGFKLIKEKAVPISESSGLNEIKEIAEKERFSKRKKGRALKKKVISNYINFNFRKFKRKKLNSFKMVIDTANAVPGIMNPYLKRKLSLEFYPLFEKLDGNFPNHNPDPLVRDNLKILCQTVKRKKADLGVAFDGDGDRVFFVDEKGNVVSADIITSFISELILKENPKEKILYDIRSSDVVREMIERAGGKALSGRIGHSFVKERMRKENILFAGELSGHFYFREHYFCEAPLIVMLKIIDQISATKKSLSQLVAPYKKYFHSGEINFKIKDKEEILKRIEKKFGTGKISKLDGLRIDFKDWWFLVRPSHTEPVLRLVLEAKTKKLLLEKTKLVSDILHG